MPTRALRVLPALILLSAIPSATAHERATGVVKERMEAMAMMAKALKAINQRTKQRRALESVRADARAIQDAAIRMPALFPVGSDKHPSQTKPAAWQNWPDFEAKAGALASEASKLRDIGVGESKALRTQAMRVSETCSSCHELYRAKHRH